MDKNEIEKIITQLRNNSTVKKSKQILADIQNIDSRLNEDVFKLAVVGEFSSGKSTFINAIIGMDLLSHSTEETTATLTYITNVNAKDDRINTCKVNYRSGKSIILKDLSCLSDYTTAQSENNVAAEISSVEIYVNFINSDYPIMIIDTPGLNGVADDHREITLEEIKKVHACIYVLPLKGISKTDIDFIYIIQQYQNKIIFLQNFKDALNAYEGETPEGKIEQIEDILKKELYDNGIKLDIEKPICLSALMALVSKDKRIERLYSDSPLLSDEERKLLYDNSGFIDFEYTLIKMIESGEYKKTIISSSLRALEQIVSELIKELTDETAEMKVLMQTDSKNKQNYILQNRIDNYKEKMSSEKKRLENFVLARKSDEFSLCKAFVKDSIDDIIDRIYADVDDALNQYEDIKSFSSRHSKMEIGEYYADKCNKEIKNLKNNLDSTIREVLQRIYTLSILQAKKYTSKKVKSNQKQIEISFSDPNIGKIDLDFNSEKQKIQKKQNELSYNRIELKNIKNNKDDNENKLKDLEKIKNREDERHGLEARTIENSINALGSRPLRRVWYTSETRTKTVYRGGIGFLDWLCGPKTETETYSKEHNNDDEIRNWDRENANLIDLKMNENEKHKNLQRENTRKIESLKRIKAVNAAQTEKIEKEIHRLSKEIQEDKNGLAFLENNAKRELLNNAKKELKELIEKKCSDSCDLLIDYLSKMFENNIPKIIDLTLDFYDKVIASKIEMLNEFIEGNEKELFTKYNSNDKDLKELNLILQKITK